MRSMLCVTRSFEERGHETAQKKGCGPIRSVGWMKKPKMVQKFRKLGFLDCDWLLIADYPCECSGNLRKSKSRCK